MSRSGSVVTAAIPLTGANVVEREEMPKYRIKKKWGSLWIFGADDGPIGPYESTKEGREEAKSDRDGLIEFDEHWEEPGWFTTDNTPLRNE